MATTIQLCLILGSPIFPVVFTAVDMHLRTSRFIAEVDGMYDKPNLEDSPEYRRQWEEERLIFEERIRKTYLHRSIGH